MTQTQPVGIFVIYFIAVIICTALFAPFEYIVMNVEISGIQGCT